MSNNNKNLGKIIKQRRTSTRLSLRELSSVSGVSLSGLSRIERGTRSPTARTLQKIAEPLGFDQIELLTLAGYLSRKHPLETEGHEGYYHDKGLHPYVAKVLAQEPVEVQRAVIVILGVLETLAKKLENIR